MADEARIRSSLQIRKEDSTGTVVFEYQARPTEFLADLSTTKGPSPGAITVSTTGTSIDLGELTTPGLCRLMNLDSTNYVEWGVWDGSSFHVLGEMLPGETFVIRLSRLLVSPNLLRMRANTENCNVLVEAFEV